MSRADTILGRFPRHFEAERPGKLLHHVVTALSGDLAVQSAQIGAVRRAHRVREAGTVEDLLRLGALHDIRAREVEILAMRFDTVARALAALAGAAPEDQPEAIAALVALWPVEIAGDPLAAFAVNGDLDAALALLLGTVGAAIGYERRRRAVSRRIVEICDIHARGNATVRALLYGTANALDLDVLSVSHSADRYLHAAFASDRLGLRPDPASGVTAPPVTREVFGIEENPLRRAELAPAERRHAECFPILRKGFEPARLEIRITAEGNRGVGPMVVNRDQLRGVGYAGTIPPGKTLVFSENGRATIGGDDVTAFAYGFDGALFADENAVQPADARLAPDDPDAPTDYPVARFITTTPPRALDRAAAYPHAGLSVPMPQVAVGKTRMAFFVQEAHFGLAADPPDRPDTETVTPRSAAGFFAGAGAPLGSVFAPGPDDARQPAALVSFAWLEREAYKVRVLIPPRFRAYSTDPEGRDITERVTQALDRFRPAGVALETRFVDDRWVLGEGILSDAEGGADDALIALRAGMALWPVPATNTGPAGAQLEL